MAQKSLEGCLGNSDTSNFPPQGQADVDLFFLFFGFAALAAGDSPSLAPEPGDRCLIYGIWQTHRGRGRIENP